MPSLRLKRQPARRVLTGLDIEPGGVRVAAAAPDADGRLVVERVAEAALEPGVVRDGEVVDPEALATTLRALFAEHGFDKRVRIGVANQRIVVRTLELPPIENPKELESAVRFQAADEIPMPLDEAVLDHAVLGTVDTDGGPRLRVAVVAARREMIERLLAAVRLAGLRPEGVDLAAFAMVRAFDEPGDAPVLHLSVGGTVNLAVGHGRECLFTRVIGGGLESMAIDLAEREALPIEEARRRVAEVDLRPRPVAAAAEPAPEVVLDEAPAAENDAGVSARGEEPVELAAEDPTPVALAAAAPAAAPEDPAHRIVEDGLRRIAAEARTTLDFHLGAGAAAAERAVLTGPAVAIPGFAEALSERLALPVVAAQLAGPEGEDAGRFAVAAGLAIEEAA